MNEDFLRWSLMNCLVVKVRKLWKVSCFEWNNLDSILTNNAVSTIFSRPSIQATALNSSTWSKLAWFCIFAWTDLTCSSNASWAIEYIAIVESVTLLTARSTITWWAATNFNVSSTSTCCLLRDGCLKNDVTDFRFRGERPQRCANQNALNITQYSQQVSMSCWSRSVTVLRLPVSF